MGHTGSVNQVAFSPDGMQLASASADGTIKVWDARSEPEARTFVGAAMAFSPDGRWLASSPWDGPFKVSDTTTGQQIGGTFDGGGELAMAFSPDGKLIALDSGRTTVKLWDIAMRLELRTFEGHTGAVTSVAFSPDGKWLASASWDHTVKLWDVATARVIHTFTGHADRVWSVAFSPDGTRLASAGDDAGDDGTVRLWDVATGQPIHTFEGSAFCIQLAFSRDGTRLAFAAEDRTIQLRDARAGPWIRPFARNTAPILGLAFSPDGRRLASTSRDGTVKLWDVATGQEALVLRGHTSMGWGVAFSPDGTRLATGDGDCRGRLWDARPWTPEAAIEREAVGLLDSLFAKPLRKADVLDYLQNAPTIRPRARDLALSLVESYHEETDPETYHRESWALARRPYLNAFQYRFALLQAEHACRLAPDRQAYRTGLGAALYRAGRYREAIETLGKADRPDQGAPAALAFLVMAHHRLGQYEQARAVLAHLRELVDQPRWAKDAETLDLMHEAQALIGSQVATTGR
jgi:dipeptidyl aminopeptidase/acylaminoacyl peptidase